MDTGASMVPLATSVRTESPSAGVACAPPAMIPAPQKAAVAAMRMRRMVTRSLCVTGGIPATRSLRLVVRFVECGDGDAVREEPDLPLGIGVVLVGAQRVEFGRVHLFDGRDALV